MRINPLMFFRDPLRWIAGILLCAPLWLQSQTPVNTTITNAYHVSYRDIADIIVTLSSDTVSTLVGPGYTLGLSKWTDVSIVAPGDSLNYHFLLTNTGNTVADGISLIDTLGTQLGYIAADPAALVVGQVIRWENLTVAPGSSLELTLLTAVDDLLPAGTEITNMATAQSGTGPPLHSNTAGVIVDSRPDLRLVKSVDRDVGTLGDTLTYTLTLSNTGNVVSTANFLHDDLPDYVQVLDWTGAATLHGGVVSWNLGSLEAGASRSFFLMICGIPSSKTPTSLPFVLSIYL